MDDIWTGSVGSPRFETGTQGGLDADLRMDLQLVSRIKDDVNTKMDQRGRSQDRLLSRAEQRQLATQLVNEWLEAQMLSSASEGIEILTTAQEQVLRSAVLAEMFGLGSRLERLMAEDDIEDIYISGTAPVIVKLRNGQRQLRDPVADSVQSLKSQLESIATHQGQNPRPVTESWPFLNMRLPGAARLAAMWNITPVPHVTIRRHQYVDITLEKLVTMGTISPAMVHVLRAAVLGRRSIMVVGGQFTGKTTLLRALAQCLPSTERFATLETEYELLLHEIPGRFPGLLPVEESRGMGELTQSGRPAGEITLDDIFPETLRHSLDRMIVGEVRGPEVRAMLKAMTRGLPGSMASFHADSPEETIPALASLMSEHQANWSLEAAHLQICQAIDLIVYIDREPLQDGSELRFVSHIYEVSGGGEPGKETINRLFAPLTTKSMSGRLQDEEMIDPRGHATGLGGTTDLRWLRRGGLDPRWLQPEQSGWTTPLPPLEWW